MQNKLPSLWLSILPIIILVGLLALTIYIFGSDALGGGSQVALLIATSVCGDWHRSAAQAMG